jgi:hypothetical protein
MWKILLAIVVIILLIIIFLPSIIPSPVKAIMPVYLVKLSTGSTQAAQTPSSESFIPYYY